MENGCSAARSEASLKERRPRGWGPSLFSFLGALWQWNRPGIARLPAECSPGPGLWELPQRVAFLGRWLCKIVGTAVAAGPPPSLAPSCQAVVFKTEAVTVIQAVSMLTVCGEKREAWRCGGRETAAGCGAGRYVSRGPDRVSPRPALEGASQSWLCRIEPGKGHLGGGLNALPRTLGVTGWRIT